MGSGSSKASSSSVRRDDPVYGPHDKGGDDYPHLVNQNKAESRQSKTVSNRKDEVDSLSGLIEWDQSRMTDSLTSATGEPF